MEKLDLKNQNLVFFDGVCHLCNGFVDALITRDRQRKLRFAPLQGDTATLILSSEDRLKLDSVVYFTQGQVFYRSTAVLKILSELGGLYRLSAVAFVIPSFLRDWAYNVIAKNRYSWFGERDFCRLPQADERDYLLP